MFTELLPLPFKLKGIKNLEKVKQKTLIDNPHDNSVTYLPGFFIGLIKPLWFNPQLLVASDRQSSVHSQDI